MTENEVATRVLDAAFRVHRELGPGLLESVYAHAMAIEFAQAGVRFQQEVGIPALYQGVELGIGFRADFVVESKVIVELKSIESLPQVALKVMLTYLRLSDHRLGIIINFPEELLKNGVKRVVNGL